MVPVKFGYRYYFPLFVYAYPLSLRLLVLSYHLLFWVHSRCPWLSSLYPDFIFILKPSHVPASMPMLYSLPFRRLALTLLISRCRKHLIIIRITDGIGILTPSPKPDQGVDAVRGHCVPALSSNNKPASDFNGHAQYQALAQGLYG